jgi:alpha-beta hydrolase superfamily lysophospholipase
LRAVLLGHQRVAAGLGIGVPILVLASARTEFARRWHEGLRVVDSVLDVEQTAARAVRLGPHVTVVRIPDGLHDLTLSAPRVREQALDEIGRFVEAYVKRGNAVQDGSVGGRTRTD